METTETIVRQRPRTLEEVISFLRNEASEWATKNHVHVVGIFGSYAKGEQTPESDLDLLVTFDRIPGLIELIGMEYELGDALGVRVQLVHDDGCEFVQKIRRDLVRL